MRADFSALLDDDDRQAVIQVLQEAGCGEDAGAAADDDHIEFHRLAFCCFAHY